MEIFGVELQVWLGLVAVVGAAVIWGLKKYKQVMADGKITLDEILDVATEAEGHADAIADEVEKVEDALEKEGEADE